MLSHGSRQVRPWLIFDVGQIEMSDERIIYNGVRVIKGWPEQVEAAQKITTVRIGGVAFSRVRYGEEKEDWGADAQPCHDCAVIKGQFHVSGCDVERCPKCGGQLFSCECDFDEDEE